MNAKNAFEELKDTKVFFGEAIHIDRSCVDGKSLCLSLLVISLLFEKLFPILTFSMTISWLWYSTIILQDFIIKGNLENLKTVNLI